MSTVQREQEWQKIKDNKEGWDQIIENKKYSSAGLSLSSKKNILIRNCEFTVDQNEGTMLSLSNCQYCMIENCKLHGKSTKGVGIKIAGGNTKYIVVKDCELYDFTYNDDNGGEPMRIGNSQSSGCWFNTLVEKCNFHDLSSDPETISLKSCGNTVRNCLTSNNESNITIRHGGYNRILNNMCAGSGGIRFYGYGNEIRNNHFQNNQSSRYPCLIVGAGTAEKDPNFSAAEKPTGKDGSSHATYAQVNANIVKDNTAKECKMKILYRTDNALKPKNSTIDEPEEGDHVEKPKPDPEVPPPVQEPIQEQEQKLLCTVCKDEPATKRLTVIVGPDHYLEMKKILVDGIKHLREQENIQVERHSRQ
jgi:Chondroitinase B